jgi:hypothetical protein
VDINLDSLKQEILDQLSSEDFSVFRAEAGWPTDLPAVYWDMKNFPEYQGFLNSAKAAGAKMLIMAHRELATSELENALEDLDGCDFSREERREIEVGLKECRVFAGLTGSLELSFVHNGFLFVYEAVTDWYQNFLNLTDSITLASESEDEGPSPLGGFYSNN